MPAPHIVSQSRAITISGATTIEEGQEDTQQKWGPCSGENGIETSMVTGCGLPYGLVTGVGSCSTPFTLRTLCKHFTTVHTVSKFPKPARPIYALKGFLKFRRAVVHHSLYTRKQPCDTLAFDQCYCSY